MKRKDFIKTCGFACLSTIALGAALEGCGSTRVISGKLDSSGLLVPLTAFEGGHGVYHNYIVIIHEHLKFPVCVYRFSEVQYSALLMRCTHQGAELQVFGDRLECPAHGSQFSNTGVVKSGPADTNLRTFPVTIQHDQLHITLS